MAGVGGCRGRAGGTCLGDRARVSLSYGPSAGTSIFPEGLSAGPGQPPGVSAGLGVSAVYVLGTCANSCTHGLGLTWLHVPAFPDSVLLLFRSF